MEHKPVFTKELIDNLNIQPAGNYADLTLGAGGHSREIWTRLKSGTLVSFDVDPAAIANFQKDFSAEDVEKIKSGLKIQSGDKTLYLVNTNFVNLKLVLSELQVSNLAGVIADLGWASDQLENVPGLSYKTDDLLDMRLDPNLQVTAADLLMGLHRGELTELFSHHADLYGKQLQRLVEGIISYRQLKPISTVTDLRNLLIDLFTKPNSARALATHSGGSHRDSHDTDQLTHLLRHPEFGDLPARVFQALRIAVNQELSILQSALPQAWDALIAGGIFEAITFHSGEDRIVKDAFASWVAKGRAEYIFAEKFLQPSVAELRENLRARSAKLRGIRKA